MGRGQAYYVLWVLLSSATACQFAFADETPLPREKPVVGEVEDAEPEDAASPRTGPPTTGGRASGATFYEVNGAVPVTWSEAETNEARAFCEKALKDLDIDYKSVPPIGGPEGCGSPAPIEVRAVAGVAIKPPGTFSCNFATKVHSWARGALQQAAKAALDDEVKSITNVATYTCRLRRGTGNRKLSEHGLANALDISSYRLRSGETVSISDDWGDSTSPDTLSAKAIFLRYTHEAACEVFSTILGPDANAAHKDHQHFDYGRGGRYGVCK